MIVLDVSAVSGERGVTSERTFYARHIEGEVTDILRSKDSVRARFITCVARGVCVEMRCERRATYVPRARSSNLSCLMALGPRVYKTYEHRA